MAGIATGLALSGKIVFTYSIANFPILRCLEQLRNDVCYHQANVVSVSVGCGFSATAEAAKGIGPVFLRLGRAGEPVVHNHQVCWKLGKAITVNEGSDVTLISTGAMLKTTVDAAAVLFEKGIKARALSMHTLKPIDKKAILDAAHETDGILTIEEHSLIGGLGGAGKDRCRRSEIRGREGTEVGKGQKSDIRSQISEGQETEIGGRRSIRRLPQYDFPNLPQLNTRRVPQ